MCPSINIIDGRDVVFLDAVNGKDTNSGLWSYQAVKTLDRALETIVNNCNRALDTITDRVKFRDQRTIVVLSANNIYTTKIHTLTGIDLEVRSSNSPNWLFYENYINLVDSNVNISGVNISVEGNASSAFRFSGKCSIYQRGTYTHLKKPLVVNAPPSNNFGRLDLTILSNEGNMGSDAKWVSSASSNAGVSVFVRCNANITNINTSADNGVAIPASALIYKNVARVS